MTTRLPSLNALRAFEVVARHLNYHLAAAELHVTPAAVKQLVTKLENSVGNKLLQRDGQGLALTAAGRASKDDLTLAMERFNSSVQKMRTNESRKQLIVTVETSFATAWLVPRLEQFRTCNPEISVLIDSTQRIVNLESEDPDIAIRYGVVSPGNLFSHRLFDDLVIPACSPSMASGPPRINTLSDLNQVPLIHWDMSQLEWAHKTRRWFTWDKWLGHTEKNDIDTGGGLHFSDYGLAVQAAIAGQGMILASWPILREPIDSGLLVCPLEEKVATDIGYDVVTTVRARNRPEVNAFVEWVIGESGSSE